MNQRNTTVGEEITVDDWRNSALLFWLWVGLPQLGTATLGPPKNTLSDQRAPIGPATSERRASRDEPEKTTVVTEEKFF